MDTFKTITDDQWLEEFEPTTDEMLIDFPTGYPPERVWTVLDCDGVQIISAGLFLVNRVGWYVTKKEHSFNIEVVDDDQIKFAQS